MKRLNALKKFGKQAVATVTVAAVPRVCKCLAGFSPAGLHSITCTESICIYPSMWLGLYKGDPDSGWPCRLQYRCGPYSCGSRL